jgi:hypothetical protein
MTKNAALARRPGILARTLFTTMDVVYGRALSLERFAALELVARVPYQAWENVAYTAVTHVSRRPGFARRIFEFVLEAREAQDNEQWHLLILEELVEKRGVRRSLLKARVIPQPCAPHRSALPRRGWRGGRPMADRHGSAVAASGATRRSPVRYAT